MAKLAFTYGVFDCLDAHHTHLINQMRKLVMPNTDNIVAVIPDDYSHFLQTKMFPIQNVQHRIKNLSYLIESFRILTSLRSPEREFSILRESNADLVFVAYEDDAFVRRWQPFFKSKNIPVRYIKRYAKT